MFCAGDDLPDRGRASRGVLRQQPARAVSGHGRVQRPPEAAAAATISSSGQAAEGGGRRCHSSSFIIFQRHVYLIF